MIYDETYFEDKESFNNYNLAKAYATKINELRAKGYLIFNEYNVILENDFIFTNDSTGNPFIGIKEGDCTSVYFGSTTDSENRVYMGNESDEGAEDIKEFFNSFRCVAPENIKKIELSVSHITPEAFEDPFENAVISQEDCNLDSDNDLNS